MGFFSPPGIQTCWYLSVLSTGGCTRSPGWGLEKIHGEFEWFPPYSALFEGGYYNDPCRWWFQTFFIFIPTWGDDPIWLIFFKWVETTNKRWCFAWICLVGDFFTDSTMKFIAIVQLFTTILGYYFSRWWFSHIFWCSPLILGGRFPFWLSYLSQMGWSHQVVWI